MAKARKRIKKDRVESSQGCPGKFVAGPLTRFVPEQTPEPELRQMSRSVLRRFGESVALNMNNKNGRNAFQHGARPVKTVNRVNVQRDDSSLVQNRTSVQRHKPGARLVKAVNRTRHFQYKSAEYDERCIRLLKRMNRMSGLFDDLPNASLDLRDIEGDSNFFQSGARPADVYANFTVVALNAPCTRESTHRVYDFLMCFGIVMLLAIYSLVISKETWWGYLSRYQSFWFWSAPVSRGWFGLW